MRKINLSIGLIALFLCIACGGKSSDCSSAGTVTEADSEKTIQLLEPSSNVINDLHSIGVNIDDQNIDEDDCYYAKLTNNSGQDYHKMIEVAYILQNLVYLWFISVGLYDRGLKVVGYYNKGNATDMFKAHSYSIQEVFNRL